MEVQEGENDVQMLESTLDNVASGSNRWLKAEVLTCR